MSFVCDVHRLGEDMGRGRGEGGSKFFGASFIQITDQDFASFLGEAG